MSSTQKTILTAALIVSTQLAFALPSLRPETTPPSNDGAITVDELGPVFAHPLAEETPPPPQAPKAPEKQQKKDLLSLFQDDKTKTIEKNPLEEEAKNELKALASPERQPEGQQDPMQLGENKQPEVRVQAENTAKEIELDKINPGSTGLPSILR